MLLNKHLNQIIKKGITRRLFTAKIFQNADEATKDIKDGNTIVIGGFGLCGVPENSLNSLINRGVKDLVVVSNTCGVEDFGVGLLLKKGQIRRLITSYLGGNKDVQRQYIEGKLELEFVPQGTLAEKLRSGGAGIPSFFTHTGSGTLVSNGGIPIKFGKDGKPEILSEKRESRIYHGQEYILENSIMGDFALIKAWKADEKGNVVFRKSARNFNPDAATAGRICIVEVEEIVPVGALDPDEIHLPDIYVNRLFKGKFEKRIEVLRTQESEHKAHDSHDPKHDMRERIVKRAAKEIRNGMYVNLGIGIPTLCVNYLDHGINATFQSENGILGLGPVPFAKDVDPDLIDAGKSTVTVLPGGNFFSSSTGFSMIRGKHMDISILGGLQVSQHGDLANWMVPGKVIVGMGGAMDLVSGAKKVIVAMEHTAKGTPKIIQECTLPLTGSRVVDMLITEQAVFTFDKVNGTMTLIEIAPDKTLEEIKSNTSALFSISPDLKTME